ncbi:MAG: hypothetical protein FGM52_01205 [Mycobacterium sp.]|nr:hypothetical protein [Mycobacterium sp.]
MATKILAPIFLAGAAAAAVILAPAAAANTAASCDDSGIASVCTRAGSAAIIVRPDVDRQSFSIAPGGNPFGAGPMPPVFALD